MKRGNVAKCRIPRGHKWTEAKTLSVQSFQCGFCDHNVATGVGWQVTAPYHEQHYVRICPHCEGPNFFDGAFRVPGVSFGAAVGKVPADIAAIYDEARSCCSTGAYTAAVLLLRKLLMHVAVDQKAAPGLTFMAYVEHLAAGGFVPPHGKGWVDHIRKKGNEANHEIVVMAASDAQDLVKFSEMLLKFIYEFPASYTPAPPAP